MLSRIVSPCTSRVLVSALGIGLALLGSTQQARADDIAFRKHVINMESEFMAAAVFDVNKDGKLDIACGGFWYEAPTWKKHFIRNVEHSGNPPRPDGYSHQAYDVNGDGWTDIISINFRSRSVRWIQNPGPNLAKAEAANEEWVTQIVDTPGSMETGRFAEGWGGILGDNTPTIYVSTVPWWYELAQSKNADGTTAFEWKKYQLPAQVAGHGAGFGDINGDGRGDLIGQNGWLEAPVDRRTGEWKWHADLQLDRASIPILVVDVNGDNRNDLIYSQGHDYGVYWLEQTRDSAGTIGWIRHAIDTSWSGAHAPLYVDMDGNGKKDLVVGRRYLAHGSLEGGPGDPGEQDPQAIYRYEYDSTTKTWQRFVVSYNDGTCFGLDPVAIDLAGDGKLDLVFGGRHGLYYFENLGKGSSVGQKLTHDPMSFPAYPDHSNLMVVKDESGKETKIEGNEGFFSIGLRRAQTLAAVQAVLGEFPDSYRRTPLDMKVVSETKVGTYTRKKVTYNSDPTSRVTAYLLIPDGATARTKAAICLHDDVPMGKDEPAGLGGRPNMNYADELAKRGFVVLVPDYPTYGEDKYDLARNSDKFASGAMKAIWDNVRGLDVLEALPEVGVNRLGGGRIAVVGHGLGGQNALLTAAFDYRVSAVITSSGFTNFAKYNGGKLDALANPRQMPRIKEKYGNDPAKIPFDFTEVLAAVAPRAVFVNAPTGDPVMGVEGVKQAVAGAEAVYPVLREQSAIRLNNPEGTTVNLADAYAWLDQRFTAGAGRRGGGGRRGGARPGGAPPEGGAPAPAPAPQ